MKLLAALGGSVARRQRESTRKSCASGGHPSGHEVSVAVVLAMLQDGSVNGRLCCGKPVLPRGVIEPSVFGDEAGEPRGREAASAIREFGIEFPRKGRGLRFRSSPV